MYLKKFEYFILDSSVAGTLLLMALAIRIEAVNAGFDQFSSNIIFISVFIISTGLYISMQIALYEIIIYLCHHSKFLSIHEHLNDSVIAPEQAFMEYEKLRSNTITEQKRTNNKKLELVHTYIHQTMAAYTSQENLQRLCAYISDFFQDKIICKNLACVFCKQGYQFILYLGQVDIFSIQRHHPFIKINDQAIPGVNRLTRT